MFEGGGVRLGGVESEGLDPRKGIFFNSFFEDIIGYC